MPDVAAAASGKGAPPSCHASGPPLLEHVARYPLNRAFPAWFVFALQKSRENAKRLATSDHLWVLGS